MIHNLLGNHILPLDFQIDLQIMFSSSSIDFVRICIMPSEKHLQLVYFAITLFSLIRFLRVLYN